eukprot:403332581
MQSKVQNAQDTKQNRLDIDFAHKRAEEILNDDQDNNDDNKSQDEGDDNDSDEYERDDFDQNDYDYQQQNNHQDSSDNSKQTTLTQQQQQNNDFLSPQRDVYNAPMNYSSNSQTSKPPIFGQQRPSNSDQQQQQQQQIHLTHEQQSDNNNIYSNAPNYAQSNSLHNTSKTTTYFNINNEGAINRNIFPGGSASKTQERYSPSMQQKVTVLDKQFRPYYLNSTYNRSASKNKKKDPSQNTQIYEGNNGQLLVSNKVIRFTENGVRQANNTQRQQLASLNKQRKANELIQNYITQVPIQTVVYVPPSVNENKSTLNGPHQQLKPLMFQPDLKLQRDSSAPKGIGTAPGGKRVRQYNRVIIDFQDKYYRKKIRPSNIAASAEELYDENMQLKNKLNQQDQFILLQKTQNKLLNNELEKQQDLLKQLIMTSATKNTIQQQQQQIDGYGGRVQINQNNNQHEILLMNLKRELDNALKALSAKETEIKQLQKQSKVTKFREVDEERKAYMQESYRLHKIIKDLITRGVSTRHIRNSSTKGLSSHRNSHSQRNETDPQQQSSFDKLQENQLQGQLTTQNTDLQTLQQQNDQLKESKEYFENQQQLLISQLQQLQHLKHEADLSVANIQNQKQQLDQHITQLHQQLEGQSKVKQQNLNAQSDEEQAKIKFIQMENNRLQSEVKTLNDKINDLNKLIEQKDMINQQEVLLLNKQLNEKEILTNEQKASVKDFKSQLSELQKENNELNEKISQLQEKLNNAKKSENNQPPMPQTLSQKELKAQIGGDVIQDDYEEYSQDDQDISGIQDNYGTMELTKKSKLNQTQQNQQVLIENDLKLQEQITNLQFEIQQKLDILTNIEKEIEDLKKQVTYKDKVATHLEEQIEQFKKQNQEFQQQHKEYEQKFENQQIQLDGLIKEMQELEEKYNGKETDLNEQKQLIEGDIKARLKRCLTILQIKDASELEKFFMSNIPIQQDFSPLDMLVMRFNFTQYESLVILEDLLTLNPKYCEMQNVIEKLIEVFIPSLNIPSDEQILDNFKELQEKLTLQEMTVETFMNHHGYDQMQMIHFLSVEKTLQLYLSNDNSLVNTMVLYLLNQSKNFTQIDVTILKRCLNLQVTARFSTTNRQTIRKNNSDTDLQRVPTPGTGKRNKIKGQERMSLNVSSVEKEQLNLKEKIPQDTENQLKLALDDIRGKQKGSNEDGSGEGDGDGTSELMQLNMNANMAFSERSGISVATKSVNQFAAQQKQIKYLKNVQLQLIAQALNSKFLNLRNKLQIFHTNQIEHILGVEVEVIKLPDFFILLKQLKVLTYEDDTEEDLQSQEMIEEMLIQIESLFTIEALDQKVIILNKLVMGLQAFGYQDHQLPKSKKGLQFDELDVKSIRILNRIVQHVQKEVVEFLKKFNINVKALNKQQMHQIYTQITESVVFKGCLTKVLLKARNKEEKCFLVTTETFYKRLKELGIKQQTHEYENLTRFLWIDQQFPQYILFKKLIKTVEILQSNAYCRAIGIKKIGLEDQTIVVKSSQFNSRQNLSSISKHSKLLQNEHSFNLNDNNSRFASNQHVQDKPYDGINNNYNKDDERGYDGQQNNHIDEESYYDEESKRQDQDEVNEEDLEESEDLF